MTLDVETALRRIGTVARTSAAVAVPLLLLAPAAASQETADRSDPGSSPGADGSAVVRDTAGGEEERGPEADGPDADLEGLPAQQIGDATVDLGGYGSFRYSAHDSESVPSSITLRRLVITTDARFGERLQVFSEVEYERLSEIEVERGVSSPEGGGLEFEQEVEGTNASEIAIEQAWAQFNFSSAAGLRFGAVLAPVGRFNLNHDDNLWNYPRRPLIDRSANVLPSAAAWPEMGLGLVGDTRLGGGATLSYQAYAMNGVQLDFAIEEKVVTSPSGNDEAVLEAVVSPSLGAFDGSNTTDAFSGRLALSPALGSEIAVSGYVGDYTPSFLEEDGTISTVGVDGRQRVGPVELEGEFLYTHYSDLDAVLTDFARQAVNHASEQEGEELTTEVETVIEGLSENRYGFWATAGWPVALAPGFMGLENPVLTPTVRYERVWFEDNLEGFDFADGSVVSRTLTDRTQERLSLGVAFRPVTEAVFHFTYERNHALDGGLLAPAGAADATNAFTFGMAFGF